MTLETRKHRSWTHAAAAILLAALTTAARADLPGPLELSVGTVYARGVGPAGGGMPELQHLAGNGAALRVEAGWRIDPRWMVGCYHEVGLFAGGHEGTDGMTSVTAGVQGQLHGRPLSTLDPWIGLGFGWRGLWLDHGHGTHAMQGLDLARVQVGVDYRISSGLTVVPNVGIAFTELLVEKRPGASAYSRIADRQVGAFVSAGVSGRFGAGGRAPDRG